MPPWTEMKVWRNAYKLVKAVSADKRLKRTARLRRAVLSVPPHTVASSKRHGSPEYARGLHAIGTKVAQSRGPKSPFVSTIRRSTRSRKGISERIVDGVTIVECPRDAWQGLRQIIPTEEKANYLRAIVSLGFTHIDAVSFVSPKHVPQMADSEAVMRELSKAKLPAGESPEIIGIVVNARGLERALAAPGVTTIGYPYSISAYFRRANANMSRAESRELVQKLQRETKAAGRTLVVYISMAFGNPYDEPWGPEIVEDTLIWLKDIGVRTVSLADTVGTASPDSVAALYRVVKDCVAGVEIGVHLHSRPEGAAEKVLAAYEAGCRRFDGALTGLGGCPFAGDALVGNIPTETVLTTLAARGVSTGIDTKSLAIACTLTHNLRERFAHATEVSPKSENFS